MDRIPDNYDIWRANEDEKERQLAARPVCDRCDNPIQGDKCYLINGDLICKDCLEFDHERNTEDFMF